MRDHFRKIRKKPNLSATFHSGLSFPGAGLSLDELLVLKEHADSVKEKQNKNTKEFYKDPNNRRKQLFNIANAISKSNKSKNKVKLAHFSIENK